jgi:hypothetical protein
VRQVSDGVCIAPYMLPFLMLVDIFLLSKKKKLVDPFWDLEWR